MTNEKIIKETLTRISIHTSFNGLANEYLVFRRLKPGDSIPINRFCNDLDYKGSQYCLDICGKYITEDKRLSDLSHDYAAYDLFSMVLESMLVDNFPNAPTTESGFIIFPQDISEYINYIFSIFKRIISGSLVLPFYETIVATTKHKPNSYKKCASTILHNKKRRTSQNFLFYFFSQYIFINKDFNSHFHTQLLKLKNTNELR